MLIKIAIVSPLLELLDKLCHCGGVCRGNSVFARFVGVATAPDAPKLIINVTSSCEYAGKLRVLSSSCHVQGKLASGLQPALHWSGDGMTVDLTDLTIRKIYTHIFTHTQTRRIMTRTTGPDCAVICALC